MLNNKPGNKLALQCSKLLFLCDYSNQHLMKNEVISFSVAIV